MGIETTWTEKEIKDIIREIINKYTSENVTLQDNTSISNNIDSLDLIELCMEIEYKFGIFFNENEEQNIYGECSVNNIYENILHYIKPIN